MQRQSIAGRKSIAVTNCLIIHIDSLVESKNQTQTITALNKLRELNMKMRFISNTTTKTTENLCKFLQEIKLNFLSNEVVTNLNAMEYAVESRSLEPMLLLEEQIADYYKTLGCKEGKINAIIIGNASTMLNYNVLNTAFKHIVNGARFISLCRNQYVQKERNLIGINSYIKALEKVAACEAEYIGVGSDFFFQFLLGELNPSEVLMITNDYNLITDVIKYGMKAYFVQEQAYTRNELVVPNGIYRSYLDAAKDLYMKLI